MLIGDRAAVVPCMHQAAPFVTGNTEPLSVGSAGHGDWCCHATVEGQHSVEMVLTSLAVWKRLKLSSRCRWGTWGIASSLLQTQRERESRGYRQR